MQHTPYARPREILIVLQSQSRSQFIETVKYVEQSGEHGEAAGRVEHGGRPQLKEDEAGDEFGKELACRERRGQNKH